MVRVDRHLVFETHHYLNVTRSEWETSSTEHSPEPTPRLTVSSCLTSMSPRSYQRMYPPLRFRSRSSVSLDKWSSVRVCTKVPGTRSRDRKTKTGGCFSSRADTEREGEDTGPENLNLELGQISGTTVTCVGNDLNNRRSEEPEGKISSCSSSSIHGPYHGS